MSVSKVRLSRLPGEVRQVMSFLTAHKSQDFVIFGGRLRSHILGIHNFSDVDVVLHAGKIDEDHPNARLFNLMARKMPQAVDRTRERQGLRAGQFKLNLSGLAVDLNFFSNDYTAPQKAARATVGISGVAMDANGTVWATDAFHKDKRDKTITVINGIRGEIGCGNYGYAARLQRDYFPDYTIVDGTVSDPQKAVLKRPLTIQHG